MTFEPSAEAGFAAREAIETKLLSFLETRLKTTVEPDQDLFARGLVASMFAMELVVQLEQFFGVAIIGTDLQLDNFRSVAVMTELVLRLQRADDA